MQWLTTKAIADEMGVASSTVRRWCTERNLPYHNIGTEMCVKIRISREALDAWVQRSNAS